MNAIGKYSIYADGDNKIKGELRYQNRVYQFSITRIGSEQTIIFENTSVDPILQGLIKRVFYKATFCIHCTACEVECPTGALSIKATSAHIDGSKCIHCKKCLTFHDFGCITAASLAVTGTTKEHKMKLISYNNFGLNEGWLSVYFSDPKAFFVNNLAGLNVKEQMHSFAKWLYQAGLIADTKTK